MGMLLEHGMPIQQILSCLIATTSSQHQKKYYQQISQHISQGLNLSQAVNVVAASINDYEYQLIILGEQTRQLQNCFKQLNDYHNSRQQLKRKITSACFMPGLTLVMAIIVGLTICTTVLPQYISLYEQSQRPLPEFTQQFINFVHLCSQWYLPSLAVAVIIGIAGTVLTKKNLLAKSFAQKALNLMPFIGPICKTYRYSHICHMLALGLQQNMNFLNILELVISSQTNLEIKNILQQNQRDISAGHPIAAAIMLTPAHPSIFIEIIGAGARQGDLAASFQHLYSYFDNKLEYQCDRLQRWLNPILLIFVASLIAIMMLALYLPLFDIGESF